MHTMEKMNQIIIKTDKKLHEKYSAKRKHSMDSYGEELSPIKIKTAKTLGEKSVESPVRFG